MKSRRQLSEFPVCGQSRDCPQPVAAAVAPEQSILPLSPSPAEAAQLALQGALEKHTKELAENPDCAWAWYRYGDSLLALKRPAEAVPVLRQAVKLAPKVPLFHYDLGLALFDLEQNAAARAQFAGIVKEDPQLKCARSNLLLSAMTNLALCQEKLGQPDEAIETLLPAADTAVGILYNLSFLHFRAKRYEAALPYAHAAYILKPNDEEVVHQYGSVLLEVRRLREAVRVLKLATELDPNCGGAWYDLGLAHARQKHRRAARGYFKRAQEVSPGQPWPFYDLACLDALEGKRAAAFRNLWEAVDRGFRDAAYLRRDKDFRSLRRDKRWQELVAMMVRLENSKN